MLQGIVTSLPTPVVSMQFEMNSEPPEVLPAIVIVLFGIIEAKLANTLLHDYPHSALLHFNEHQLGSFTCCCQP